MGAKLLVALTNQDLSSLQVSAATGGNDLNGDILNLGAINDSSYYPPGYREVALAHELFHVYQQNSMDGYLPKEIYIEVEAKIFEYEIVSEFGDETFENNWFIMNFKEGDYREGFRNFLAGDEQDLDAFNDLIEGYKDGQNGGGAYSDYQETLLEEWPSLIDTLFNISLEEE